MLMKSSLAILTIATSCLASASVSSIKNSAPRAVLVEDSFVSTVSDPAFISNDLGGTWKADIDLSQAKGELNNVTLGSNVNGAPSIDLSNSKGSNKDISDIGGGSPSLPQKGVWIQIAKRASNSTAKLSFNLPTSLSTLRPKNMRINGKVISYNGNSTGFTVGKSWKGSRVSCSQMVSLSSYCSVKVNSNSVTGCVGTSVTYWGANPAANGCAAVKHTYRALYSFNTIEVMY